MRARVVPLIRSRAEIGACATPATSDAPPENSADASGATPTWRRATQCGWCAIGDDHPELLVALHEAHTVTGIGSRALVRLAERRLNYAAQDLPSARAMSRHLKLHLVRDRPSRAIQSGDEIGTPPASLFEGQELHELWALHARLDRRLRQLDAATSLTSDGNEVDLNRLAQLSGMANAQRAVLVAIGKVRGSSTITVRAVEHALRLALRAYTELVVSELRDLADTADGKGATELAARVRSLVAHDSPIPDGAVRVARDAAAETLRALKIDTDDGNVTGE